MTVVTKCPECGFESEAVRCPRCNVLKIKGCDGVCSACAVSCAGNATHAESVDGDQPEDEEVRGGR